MDAVKHKYGAVIVWAVLHSEEKNDHWEILYIRLQKESESIEQDVTDLQLKLLVWVWDIMWLIDWNASKSHGPYVREGNKKKMA